MYDELKTCRDPFAPPRKFKSSVAVLLSNKISSHLHNNTALACICLFLAFPGLDFRCLREEYDRRKK